MNVSYKALVLAALAAVSTAAISSGNSFLPEGVAEADAVHRNYISDLNQIRWEVERLSEELMELRNPAVPVDLLDDAIDVSPPPDYSVQVLGKWNGECLIEKRFRNGNVRTERVESPDECVDRELSEEGQVQTVWAMESTMSYYNRRCVGSSSGSPASKVLQFDSPNAAENAGYSYNPSGCAR